MLFRSIRHSAFAISVGVALICLPACAPRGRSAASPTSTPTATILSSNRDFSALESEYNVRLGVWALDTGSGHTVAWRADERFAYASMFKALACAAVLRRDSASQLNRIVTYTRADLVDPSPISQQHVSTGMTVLELCDAAIRYSDNTAANLLLRELGGPEGLNASLKLIGDDTTHAARIEPAMSNAIPGDVRDTSTPKAFGSDLMKFVLSDAFPSDRRALLADWLLRNTTGSTLIRAGVPEDWKVGDKTGTGGYGARNDMAVLWPPQRAPIVLVIMSTHSTPNAMRDDTLIAKAARAAINALG